MTLEALLRAIVYAYVALYIISTPVSAWQYPLSDPAVAFPETYESHYDYALHTVAYIIACSCFLLFLLLIGSFMLMSLMFTLGAAEQVASAFSKSMSTWLLNWRRNR